MNKKIIFDFDSTLIKLETLDVLAEISLYNDPQKEDKIKSIELLTNYAMEGKISFSKSLDKRLKLLNPNKEHIKEAIPLLINNLSESIKLNLDFFKIYKESIYVVSGGFKEMIIKVTQTLGISDDNVFANSFIYDKDIVVGVDQNNLMSQDNGKSKVLQSLNLEGQIIMIGDGYTDYEVKLNTIADYFIAYTENIKRNNVCKLADSIATNISDIQDFIMLN